MSCEKQGGLSMRLSLIDGSLEPVHFRSVEEILASINQLPEVEFKSVDTRIKRSFVPFLTDVNMTGL